MCSTCARNYFRGWVTHNCYQCSSSALWTTVGVAFGLLGLALVSTVTFSAATKLRRKLSQNVELGRFVNDLALKLRVKVFVFVVTMQIVCQFTTATGGSKAQYPRVVIRFAECIGGLNFDVTSALPPSCLISGANFYTKLLLIPVSALGVVVMIWLVPPLLEAAGTEISSGFKGRVTTLFLELCLPTMTKVILQTFVCNYYGARRFLRADLSIDCDASGRGAWLAFAALLGVTGWCCRGIGGCLPVLARASARAAAIRSALCVVFGG